MAISVEELATWLDAEARRRGITTEELIDEFAARLAPSRRKLGFVSLGSSSSGRSAADADDMLARASGATSRADHRYGCAARSGR